MKPSEGRQIYKEILSRARVISAEQGATQLVKGSVSQAAREKWEVIGQPWRYETWWAQVHAIGVSPVQTTNGAVHEKLPRNASGDGKTYIERFRSLIGKYDVLPPDMFLAEQWGCDKDTPGRLRSRFGKEGYVFAKRDSVWHVVTRPQPSQTAPEQRTAADSPPTVDVQVQLPLQSEEPDQPKPAKEREILLLEHIALRLSESWLQDKRHYDAVSTELTQLRGLVAQLLQKWS